MPGQKGQKDQVRVMFPDDVQHFMREQKEGTYVLLDVRQPVEYEKNHLPGARLIPLPELADSMETLHRSKPTIVYCAVGGRSRMAAQLLMNQGFRDVYHLMGGIEAWDQPVASGPTEFHLKFMRGDESPLEMILMGYEFEEGLRKFHETVKHRTTDREFADLLTSLTQAEESHKQTLLSLVPATERVVFEQQIGGRSDDVHVMEGGIDLAEFMERNESYLQTISGYLELAMMIETQALDLYLRMAAASRQQQTREVLLRVSEEEKAHLAALGRLLEHKI